MIYKSEPGKINDTIFFFIEHFNKDYIEKEYINSFDDTSFMIECYEDVKKTVGEIPDFLSPMFFIEKETASPLSMFFSSQMDFKTDNIDVFIMKLTTHTDLLYQRTVDAIFTEYQKKESKKLFPAISPGSYIDEVKSLDMPLEFKLQLSLLLGNFNYAVSLLAGLMKKVYLSVSELHNKYRKEIIQKFEQIQSEKNIQLYHDTFEYDPESADKTTVSVTLLNQYIVFSSCKIKTMTYLILGYNHEDSLNENRNVELISLERFAIACGNDLRIRILKSIWENEELTASQIARNLGNPITTMIRHLDVLDDSGIIYISRREGLQIFYKINLSLFKKMKVKIDELFNKIINNTGEKNEK